MNGRRGRDPLGPGETYCRRRLVNPAMPRHFSFHMWTHRAQHRQPADRLRVTPQRLPPGLIAGAAALLGVGGLMFDVLTPQGVSVTVFYVAMVLVGYWFPHSNAPLALALVATVLIAAGYFLSPSGVTPLQVLWANRALSIGTTWIAAVFLWHLRNLQLRLQRQVDIALRLSGENRLLAAIVENSDDAIVSKTLDGIIMSWNRGATRLFGYLPEEIIGRSVIILIPPERRHEEEMILASVRSGVPVDHYETARRRKDGTDVDIALTVSPVRDANGTVIGASTITRDVTERRRAEEDVRQSEERFRSSVIKSPVPTLLFDDREQIVAVSRSWLDAAGVSADELKEIGDWTALAYGDRSGEVLKIVRQIIATRPEAKRDELTVITQAGDRRIWDFVTSALGTLSDGRQLFISVALDVTDRKAYEERIRLLMREARHRVKNVLTLVQAIIRHTRADNVEDFVDRFTARIRALATHQDLLVLNETSRIELRELVNAQLEHFADLVGRRITITGPALHLNPAAAQSLGLALHELATNAAKHGALSVDRGRVDIAWQRDGDTFTMSWTERDGPQVAPPKQRGFGTTVVEAMVRHATSGEVRLDFAASGLQWRLRCPAAEVLEAKPGSGAATPDAAPAPAMAAEAAPQSRSNA